MYFYYSFIFYLIRFHFVVFSAFACTVDISDDPRRQPSLYGDSEQRRLPAEQRCDWPEPRGGGGLSPSPFLPRAVFISSPLLPTWRSERCGDNRTQSRREEEQDARIHIQQRHTALRRLPAGRVGQAHLTVVCALIDLPVYYYYESAWTGWTLQPPNGNPLKGEYWEKSPVPPHLHPDLLSADSSIVSCCAFNSPITSEHTSIDPRYKQCAHRC